MTPTERITKLAQSAQLAVTGRYKDVEGTELTDMLNQTIDWVNQLLEEIEMEADWNYLRENNYTLGNVQSAASQTVELDDDVRKVVVSPYRDLILAQDGSTVARFALVSPDQISDPRNPDTSDRVTVVNRSLIFSRPFTEEEVGADMIADIIASIPDLSLTNSDALDLVKPYQLLVLGLAKNMTLPDLVRGGTSPSFVQKYNDLLQKAVAENNATAEAFEADRENLSFVAGVW